MAGNFFKDESYFCRGLFCLRVGLGVSAITNLYLSLPLDFNLRTLVGTERILIFCYFFYSLL
jgi:hypothetical protein